MIPLLVIVSTHALLHDSISIASGDKAALVLWDEQATIGGQRTVAGAIVDDHGYGYNPIRKLLDGGGEPDTISAVWTGEAWTVAICNDAWGTSNRERVLAWGQVSAEGVFTQQGEEHFGPTGGAFHCSNLQVNDGVPYLYVATHDEHCAARRVELGSHATFGPERALCNVWGGIGDAILGVDEQDRPAMWARGELHRTAITSEVSFGSRFLVTREQATLRFWKAPFTSPATTQRLRRTPIDPFGPAYVKAAGDAVLVMQLQRDQAVAAVYDKTGLVWNDSFTAKDVTMLACTLVGRVVVCAWADNSDVHAWTLSP